MGDPACWLDRVCDGCGRLREDGDVGPTCPRCGAPWPDPGEGAGTDGVDADGSG